MYFLAISSYARSPIDTYFDYRQSIRCDSHSATSRSMKLYIANTHTLISGTTKMMNNQPNTSRKGVGHRWSSALSISQYVINPNSRTHYFSSSSVRLAMTCERDYANRSAVEWSAILNIGMTRRLFCRRAHTEQNHRGPTASTESRIRWAISSV